MTEIHNPQHKTKNPLNSQREREKERETERGRDTHTEEEGPRRGFSARG